MKTSQIFKKILQAQATIQWSFTPCSVHGNPVINVIINMLNKCGEGVACNFDLQGVGV